MNIAIKTFGCRLNRAESLDLEAKLRNNGYKIVDLESNSKNAGHNCTENESNPINIGHNCTGNESNSKNIDYKINKLSPNHSNSSSQFSPDVILIRGCSVTGKAQRDCEKEIARLHSRYPSAKIVIGGCLPNAVDLSAALPPSPPKSTPFTAPRDFASESPSFPARRDFASESPSIPAQRDFASESPSAPARRDFASEAPSVPAGKDSEVKSPKGDDTVVPMNTSRAYLKIQDGCSGKCAFCIVPQFRGKPRSLPFDDVLRRARAFLDAGFNELVVTGCNLALYRCNGKGLPDLLAALAELKSSDSFSGERDFASETAGDFASEAAGDFASETAGDFASETAGDFASEAGHRIRLGSLEPGICDDEIIEVFAKHSNICRFIHLSLQSGSDSVLKRMNRPYSIEKVARFREKVYEKLGPFVTLGADVITGFPGESDEDFKKTLDFVSEGPLPFTNLHVFPYSERPGTPAADMTDRIPREVRIARAKELERRGQSLHAKFAESFIGKTVEVCVEIGSNCRDNDIKRANAVRDNDIERVGDHGWSGEYLKCRLSGTAPRRSLVNVIVDRIENGNLIAK